MFRKYIINPINKDRFDITSDENKLHAEFVNAKGDTMTGNLTFNNASIINPNQIQFNVSYVPNGETVGTLYWNNSEGTLDLKLKGGNVTLQVGQEMVKRVVNKTGENLLESQYKVVRVRKVAEGGAQGQRLAVKLAQADNENNSTDILGLVTENIALNEEGFVTTVGEVNKINTTGSLQGESWADGDILFLSPTVAGGLTKVKPQAPDHLIIIGYVEYAHQNQGKIFVFPHISFELDELHDVRITDVKNQDILYRNTNTNLWENKAFSTPVFSSTPTNPIDGQMYINSVTGYLNIYYSGSWYQLHSLAPSAESFFLLENGDYFLLENGDRLILG